ncbi:MAG: hypothetical protein GWN93_14585 [Deltaproteobacteria bacterium]|nr:hypothetical protein [Deltaproteobacteria bacterium]
MRRIVSMLSDIRQLQMKQAGVKEGDAQLRETANKFRWFDNALSGITPTSTNAKLEEVMTSADFAYAITEFVQRQMVPGYKRTRFNFEPLVWNDTAPNFLTVTRYQKRAGLEDLEFVGQKGVARPGSVVEATKRQYRVYRWAKQFDFSMEALINDDLGYFEDQATLMGEAARRTLEKYVSRFYTNATTIARLTGLGALYMQNGRLTSTRISECRMAFGQRVDTRNEPIDADLAYIVYHRGLEDTVRQIQASQLVPELATNAENVVRTGWTGIKDPYIAGAAPNLPWYGFTNHRQNGIRPFVLARRQGMPAPMLMRKRSDIERITSMLGGGATAPPILGDFDTGNVVVKVEDQWGTYIDDTEGNLFDYRGAYYSSGTAA